MDYSLCSLRPFNFVCVYIGALFGGLFVCACLFVYVCACVQWRIQRAYQTMAPPSVLAIELPPRPKKYCCKEVNGVQGVKMAITKKEGG